MKFQCREILINYEELVCTVTLSENEKLNKCCNEKK